MAEVAVTLALVGLFAGVAIPALRSLLDRRALDAAAGSLASAMARTRHEAIARGRNAGLHFERDAMGDRWAIYVDGGKPGISTAEIHSGEDRRIFGPVPVGGAQDAGVRLGIPMAPPIPAVPPSRGRLPAGGDPVRLGGSDILSFSPIGESSSGSIYLTDGKGGLRAIVIYGRSGRIRTWSWSDRSHWHRQ